MPLGTTPYGGSRNYGFYFGSKFGRDEFKRRRRALMKLMGRGSIAIVPTRSIARA